MSAVKRMLALMDEAKSKGADVIVYPARSRPVSFQ